MGCSASSLAVVDPELAEATYANTPPFLPDVRWAKVVKVYDGDSITVAARVGNSGHSSRNTRGQLARFAVRLAGIDCPELKSKNPDERAAAVHARDMLRQRVMDKIVELRNVKYDKYGRLLADVMLHGQSMSAWLLEARLAVPYDGGTKPVVDWRTYT